MKRVHIGLAPAFKRELKADDAEAAALSVERLADRFGLEKVNLERARRFGLLSADAPDEVVDRLEDAAEIDWVEEDGAQKAL